MPSAEPRTPVIAVERRIVIQAPLAQVFAYVADLRNDAAWRAEINGTELNAAAPGLGVVATEDAHLSAKLPHALSRLEYVAYVPDAYVRCTAVADNPTWTDVERRFRALGPGQTEFTYQIRFERLVVQQALGFAPPLWFLRWYTSLVMGRYLGQLKNLLETAPRLQAA